MLSQHDLGQEHVVRSNARKSDILYIVVIRFFFFFAFAISDLEKVQNQRNFDVYDCILHM